MKEWIICHGGMLSNMPNLLCGFHSEKAEVQSGIVVAC